MRIETVVVVEKDEEQGGPNPGGDGRAVAGRREDAGGGA